MERLSKHSLRGCKLRADRRGVAAVEFALVSLPFLVLVFGFIELAYDLYCSSALDSATQAAARQIMTGQVQSEASVPTAAQFRSTVLCPLLPTNFDCSNLVVNIQTFAQAPSPAGFYSFVNSSQSGLIIPPLDNTQTAYCLGSAGQYVIAEVLYPMPLLTGIFASEVTTSFNGHPAVILSSAAAFRNEPFSSTTYQEPNGC